YIMSTNFFTQTGSSMESCAPYQGIDGILCNSTCEITKNVNGWKLIANDVDTIKTALYNNGPIATAMYASDPAFSAYTGGIYEYSGSSVPNHAVLIVGWDDALGSSGAWIVKNSWGADWGIDGYCYIAYGNASMGEISNYISSYKTYNPNELLMYYDEGGLWSAAGYNSNSCYAAVLFSPSVTGTLVAVDFWTTDDNVSYNIEIYDEMINGEMVNLLTSQSGSCDEFGYYSIVLDNPISVTNGDNFVVSIEFTTNGYGYPVPIDTNYPIEWGKCYLSSDGISWEPIGGGTPYNWDVALRARVVSNVGPITTSTTMPGQTTTTTASETTTTIPGDYWIKIYGAGDWGDTTHFIQKTEDHGCIVLGETWASSAGVNDIWILKLDNDGLIEWQKMYGGGNGDRGNAIRQTSDGGYIVAGETTSFSASGMDAWIFKLDTNGSIL
ncbi:unnamed protein product, partial [marine sediment metagenome]